MQKTTGWVEPDWRRVREVAGAWLERRAVAAVRFFTFRMEKVIACWLAGMTLLALAKVVAAPGGDPAAMVPMALPFLLVTMAPVIAYRIADRCFPAGGLSAQPAVRLCRYGAWRAVDPLEARRNPAYGPTGFMASLLAGLLLNVPFRSAEFMLAMPAIPATAPQWATTMMAVMTLDVVALTFFYTVCFVAALRGAPLFPRLLIFTWALDVMMQLQIAEHVSHAAGLPSAVAHALQGLLSGNLDKVMISAALWLPYLILSERVNVTFRHRVRC